MKTNFTDHFMSLRHCLALCVIMLCSFASNAQAYPDLAGGVFKTTAELDTYLSSEKARVDNFLAQPSLDPQEVANFNGYSLLVQSLRSNILSNVSVSEAMVASLKKLEQDISTDTIAKGADYNYIYHALLPGLIEGLNAIPVLEVNKAN